MKQIEFLPEARPQVFRRISVGMRSHRNRPRHAPSRVQKQSEAKRSQALADLSVMCENAPVAMMLIDRDWRVCHVNRFAATYAGRPAGDMLGITCGEALGCLHHRDDPQGCGFGPLCAQCRIRQTVARTFKKHLNQSEVEAWLPFSDGAARVQRCLLISTVYLNSGMPNRVGVYVQDVTEGKQTQAALKESEARFSRAFALNPSPLVISDIDTGLFIDVNDRWVRMLGYTREEQIGRTSGEVGIWNDPAERKRLVENLQNNGVFKDEPIKFRSKTGQNIHALWSAVAITLAGRPVMLTMIHDDTVRQQTMAALQESESQFRSLIEGAPYAVFIQDDARFVYVNAAALQLCGAESADQLLGTPILARYHPDSHHEICDFIRMLHQEKKKISRCERVCLRLDGTAVPVELSAVPVIFEGQSRSLVFVQDISERKQIEIRLQRAQKMEAIGTLAGGIAHDFNNVLFPIAAMSEILLEDFETGSPHHGHVTLIHDAAVRAKNLVAQILAFSRQAEHEKIPVRLQDLLKEVHKLIRATIPSNIAIHQEIQTDCGMVLADPSKVHQIIMNLMTNAFHAVEQSGGSIGIALRQTYLTQHDTKRISLAPGAYALLTVSDTGHGICAEVLPKIFDPYFTTKPQGKGTGMGLAMVYGIVKEHDGDIRVVSEVGQGTTFNVYLPLIQRDVAAETLKISPKYAGGTESILVVDDEAPVVRVEKKMLERLGYQVTTHTNSVEALATFKAAPAAYDLVITDMAMPAMTGDQLAKHLVAVRPDIPVILCTGFSENLFTDPADLSVIKEVLMKPIAIGDLAERVRKVLDDA
jgi:PAS domain S-box-containing protein